MKKKEVCLVNDYPSEIVKKEYNVQGLECLECSSLIENEVKQIEGASFKLENGTLTLISKQNNDLDILINKIKTIISKHHPSIIIKQPKIKKVSYKVSNLDCASCALKIQDGINKLDEVNLSSVDFAKGEVDVEFYDSFEESNLVKKIKKIIKDIEPGARLLVDDEEHEEGNHHFVLFRIISSLLLFVTSLIFHDNKIIHLVLSLSSYLIIGYDVLLRSIKNILRGQIFDENFLMSIATVGALFLQEYSEAVAVMLFYQVGEFFQHLAVDRSRKSITELMNLKENFAYILINGEERQVNVEDVKVNDVIVVRPGGKIPLDGIVINGSSYLDLSSLNGESMLKAVNVNDEVLSGSINKNSALTIKVTKAYEDSTVAKILELVENATKRKAKSENFITKFAKYYTPIVLFSALFIFLIPVLFLGGSVNEWLYRALIFLVISCPCALVISIPLSFFAGIGASSKLGILVKGGNYLEALNEVNTVVFDKTGTLTKGEFKVTKVHPINTSKDELLEYAAYGEAYSNHPLAKAIKDAYQGKIDLNRITSYEEVPGMGTKIILDHQEILLGNHKILNKEVSDEEGTVVHVVKDKEYLGYLILEDEIKEDVKETIKNLHALNINKTIMLSGDKEVVAKNVASKINIDEVYAELLPQDKVDALDKIKQNSKGKVIYVGDGINDAPVLAMSDIGISMGKIGSDAAIEASDIVIMSDEPKKIVTALKLAKRTRRIVYSNIIFAIGVKLFFLLLGAMGIATMWEAVFADVGVSLIAILNATRLLNIKKLKDN